MYDGLFEMKRLVMSGLLARVRIYRPAFPILMNEGAESNQFIHAAQTMHHVLDSRDYKFLAKAVRYIRLPG